MDIDVNKMSRADLEVMSRRMESELSVLNGRAAANPQGFRKTVDDRTKNYQAVQKRIRELDQNKGAVDPEGTSQTLSDAEGNYARDARTAHVGGVGVKNSNTDPDGTLEKQRKRLEESGVNTDEVTDDQLAGVDPGSEDETGDQGNQPKPKPVTQEQSGKSARK